jgi:carboxypeptidase Q
LWAPTNLFVPVSKQTTPPTPMAFSRYASLSVVISLLTLASSVRSQGTGSAVRAAPVVFTTDDSVIKRIWRTGMDSSWLPRLAQPFLDSIGPRLDGSPGLSSAQRWLADRYREWHVPARLEHYGKQRAWQRVSTHIDLVAPRRRTLEGSLLAWSNGTSRPTDGEAVLLPDVRDSTEFARTLAVVRGRYVLVSPAQAACRPDDDIAANATPQTLARLRRARAADSVAWQDRVKRTGYAMSLGGTGTLGKRLDAAGIAGIITTDWAGGWGADHLFSTDMHFPAFMLDCEDYGLVFRLAEHGQHPVVRLDAEAHDLGEVPTSNVIAELRGTERPNEYVVLSAHLDSWDGGSGATDNGTGTLMMLEAARILHLVYPHPKRTILIAHWGGEEMGLVGSSSFAADHPDVVRGLQVLFNQDNGTGRVQIMNGGGLLDMASALARWTSQMPGDITQYLTTYRTPGYPVDGSTDQTPFICSGAPGLRLRSRDWEYYTYTWHTTRDTYDKLVFDDLETNAVMAAMFAYLASEDSLTVARDRRVLLNGDGSTAPWPTCPTPLRNDPHP